MCGVPAARCLPLLSALARQWSALCTLLARAPVDPPGRLAEDVDRGFLQQGAREQHLLLVAARQGAERAVGIGRHDTSDAV